MKDKQLPTIRANSKELNQIFTLFASAQELEHTEKTMERRVRAIPDGWRRLRLCRTLLDTLVVDMVGTLQPEKIASMRRMLPKMRFRVLCGPTATKPEPDEVTLVMHDLNVLVHYAHEANCKMCVEPHCRRCQLGKTLDSIVTYDRNESSWSAVDLDAEDV